MTTLSDALVAYRICAQAEGRSPRTIEWITSSVRYFSEFLGGDPELSNITQHDLRRFIIALQNCFKYRKHPYNKSTQEKLSLRSIETYCRGIRAFFGFLSREELTDTNPMEKVKLPKVPSKVTPTFSTKEVERLLAQPDRTKKHGFRDYTIMLVLVDTGARVSEIANLTVNDADIENGHLRVTGKGGKERHIPFGYKVAKALLKYKLKYRGEPAGNDRFFLSNGGRPISVGRIERVCRRYGEMAGLERCYPHKLRHTSSVIYLRNGGDPFSLQKKLGHSSLQMTRHYCELADADVRAAHLKFGVADRLSI